MKQLPGSLKYRIALALAFVSLVAILGSQPAPREQVGPLPGGAFLLNSGWRVDPVGRQVPLDTLPMSTALSPDGKYLLVLNGGYRPPSVSVIETASARVTGSVPVADGWLGLAMSPKGDRVYVGGGSKASLFEFAFANGVLTPARTFVVVPQAQRGTQDFIGDVALSPDGRLLYAANLYRDTILVVNPQSGMVIGQYKTGRRPYRILFHPDGKSFFVTHWADGTRGPVRCRGRQPDGPAGARRRACQRYGVARRRARKPPPGEAPPYTARIFVAAANTNQVFALGVTPAKDVNVVESINIAMTPRQPLGMTPSALGPERRWQASLRGLLRRQCRRRGGYRRRRAAAWKASFLPAGIPPRCAPWPNGTLVVLNGKGLRSYPNAENGPNPSKRPNPVHAGEPSPPAVQFVARMQTGTASWIEPFTAEQLNQWTARTLANSPYRDAKLDETSPLPKIEHVIYIVKENRSYDQVLGDMKEGNGDPSLVLFGENFTPNHHKLAREFVLLDNFYVNSDVSADGHNWSTAAISPDYVEKMWPNKYANRRTISDFAEQDPASLPPAGYLWTNAAAAGISHAQLRLHGEQQTQCGARRRTDHRRARPGAGQGHQPPVSRL